MGLPKKYNRHSFFTIPFLMLFVNCCYIHFLVSIFNLSFEFRSEFCRILNSDGNYCQSHQNHVPMFCFLYFCRQELLYLDLRSDTRICGSLAESYCNHTHGIQHVITCVSANTSHPNKNTIIIAICIAQSWLISN